MASLDNDNLNRCEVEIEIWLNAEDGSDSQTRHDRRCALDTHKDLVHEIEMPDGTPAKFTVVDGVPQLVETP